MLHYSYWIMVKIDNDVNFFSITNNDVTDAYA